MLKKSQKLNIKLKKNMSPDMCLGVESDYIKRAYDLHLFKKLKFIPKR